MDELEVLYEDNHLIIVNKRNGMLTHGDKTGDISLEEIAKKYIREKYKKPGNVFIKSVHRLDRPVSGAIILARTSKGHERMAGLFRNQTIEKVYWALTVRKPRPPAGTVVQYLEKDQERNVVSWHDEDGPDLKEAITDYRILARIAPYYLIELRPKTGRSHQLRVMLRSKRCPIVGDVKYNGRRIESKQAVLLHSRRLRFTHPIRGVEIDITAGTPDIPEWQSAMATYAGHAG